MKRFIKAYRFKKYLLILILLKFFDIMTTIYAIRNLNAREVNPLGYDIVIIASIILMFAMFYIAKYYSNHNTLYVRLKQRNFYTTIIIGLSVNILLYTIVVSNNLLQILKYSGVLK